eukprot:TRINITY_DN99950_c0_g1_i1.p1 TRINITY_DN99950_c0_g1~~TRINITY_DN99950_c0_g1_i1.p1  ORF type:complete len:288 (-),score=39.17 TRINITY_DN99950_c0_g1_i1:150-1013(-)
MLCQCGHGLHQLLLGRRRSSWTISPQIYGFAVTVTSLSGESRSIAGVNSQSMLYELRDRISEECSLLGKVQLCLGTRVFSESDILKPLQTLGIGPGAELTVVLKSGGSEQDEDLRGDLCRLAATVDFRTSFADLAPSFETARRLLARWSSRFVAPHGPLLPPSSMSRAGIKSQLCLGLWQSREEFEHYEEPSWSIRLAGIKRFEHDPEDQACVVLFCPLDLHEDLVFDDVHRAGDSEDEAEVDESEVEAEIGEMLPRPVERIELGFPSERAARAWCHTLRLLLEDPA